VLPNAVGIHSHLGNNFTNVIDLANNFNNYFYSIGEKLSNKIIQPQGISFNHYLQVTYINSVFMEPTNCNEVYKIITNLQSLYTAGEDEICSKILKAIALDIMEPTNWLIDLSLLSGIVLKGANIARIVPVFKSVETNEMSDYRPYINLAYNL